MTDSLDLIEAANVLDGRAILFLLVIELLALEVEAEESHSLPVLRLKERLGLVTLQQVCHQGKLCILPVDSRFEDSLDLLILEGVPGSFGLLIGIRSRPRTNMRPIGRGLPQLGKTMSNSRRLTDVSLVEASVELADGRNGFLEHEILFGIFVDWSLRAAIRSI